jgi:hypothetical protein
MTLHDRIDLGLKWFLILGGAAEILLGLFLLVSPDSLFAPTHNHWQVSQVAQIVITRAAFLAVLYLGVLHFAKGLSIGRKPKAIVVEALTAWRTIDRGQCSCSFER